MLRKKHFIALALPAFLVACGGPDAEELKDLEADIMSELDDMDLGMEEESTATPYSPEAAAAAIEIMKTCESAYSCQGVDDLVAMGADAAPAVEAVALDVTASEDARENACHVLSEIGVRSGGMELFEAGKASDDSGMRRELFGAAASAGDPTVITAMLEFFVSEESDDMETEVLIGLRDAPKETVMPWITTNFDNHPNAELNMVNLLQSQAGEGDVAFLESKLGNLNDPMATARLAESLISFGQTQHYPVLVEVMKDGDKYNRSVAAQSFREVHKDCPEELKAEIIPLLESIMEEDASGQGRKLGKVIAFLKGEA